MVREAEKTLSNLLNEIEKMDDRTKRDNVKCQSNKRQEVLAQHEHPYLEKT